MLHGGPRNALQKGNGKTNVNYNQGIIRGLSPKMWHLNLAVKKEKASVEGEMHPD